MSDTSTKTRKRPDYTAYFVPDREGSPWRPIGAAWSHDDGEGFNVKLDLLPIAPGRIVIRKPKTDTAEGAQ